MMYFLIAYSIIVTLTLLFSVIMSLRFAKYVFRLEEAIEMSIDKLDESYRSISRVLKIPVASHDPHVVQVVNAIKDARSNIAKIAKQLSVSADGLKESNDNATKS